MQAFVDCTSVRTVTVYFACHEEKKNLNNCLKQYTTEEAYDAFRDDVLKAKLDRMNKTYDLEPPLE
jgi:hypothetical protein